MIDKLFSFFKISPIYLNASLNYVSLYFSQKFLTLLHPFKNTPSLLIIVQS